MQPDAPIPYMGSPEEGYADPNITIPAQRLARAFAGRFAGFGGHRLRQAASSVMQMLLDEGIAEPVIVAEVMNPARPRDMKLWDFPGWVRSKAQDAAEATGPDGEVKAFDLAWAVFRTAFTVKFLARDAQAPYLADWKEDCRARFGAETTAEELLAAVTQFASDPQRGDPKFASRFWPRNAWAYISERIMAARKRRKTTSIRLQDDGKPPPPLPEGYSSMEAARRVREAKLIDPQASAADIIAAYKRDLEGR